MTSEKMLSTREAAEFLGVGVSTLEKRRCMGGGPPYHKLFGRVVYSPADLRDWTEQRRRQHTSQPEPEVAHELEVT